jgi:Putative transposase/Transposase zinc-binding domain
MAERPPLEVADVVRAHGAAFRARHGDRLTAAQRRALQDVAACRTAAVGGHVLACGACGERQVSYNSCRNRHGPKCQAWQRAAWLERAAASLLPVDYYHVVFTVAALALANPATVYGLLVRAAQETVREVAADPKHLGAAGGVLAGLHTWGQDLHHHPHVHTVVTGGGLACAPGGALSDPPRWVGCRPGFFLPVRVLSRVCRGTFLAYLRQAQAAGRLALGGRLARLAESGAFAARLRAQYRAEWVVYAKPPFGGPERVLKYLAGYTHRGPISNRRLVGLADGRVTFTAKDYRAGGRVRRRTLGGEEFLRRWVQHVLPGGLVRVRHYGLLANRWRRERLSVCRALLALAGLVACLAAAVTPAAPAEPRRCPACGAGVLAVVGAVLPAGAAPAGAVAGCDPS